MKKYIYIIIIVIVLVGVGYWYNQKSGFEKNSANNKPTGENIGGSSKNDIINLKVVNDRVRLGDVINVTWDASKIPANANGISLHIVRPDGDFVSATGVGGVNPRLGSFSLQQLPNEPFYGFVENGDYYITARVTNTSDPNGNTLINARSGYFKISTK